MPNLVTDELLGALAQVESGNDSFAVGDHGLANPAYGAYQMRLPAYQDVVQAYPQFSDIPLERILGNLPRQRELADAYLSLLNTRYGMTTLEQLIGAYNAGPGNIRRGRIPSAYIQKVKSRMVK